MPILAAEPTIYPQDLFDELAGEPSQRCWWAVYTRARQEKALARQLLTFRIPFYLPLVRKQSLIRGRRVTSHVPLFSGYLFLFATESERVQCLTTNRVSQMIAVTDSQQLVRDLRSVKQLIEADAPLTVERRLVAGQRVRVKAGTLLGTEGTVLTQRGRSKLVVAVQFLQQGVSMEIDDFLLEPID